MLRQEAAGYGRLGLKRSDEHRSSLLQVFPPICLSSVYVLYIYAYYLAEYWSCILANDHCTSVPVLCWGVNRELPHARDIEQKVSCRSLATVTWTGPGRPTEAIIDRSYVHYRGKGWAEEKIIGGSYPR